MDSQPTPVPPDTATATPFGNAPTEPQAGGCGRVGLIGCGILILLLGVAAVVFLLKAGDLFGWALGQFETEISRALPEDMSEEDRQRLRAAFQGAAEAVRSGEFDPSALQRLQGILRDSLLDDNQRLTPDQVDELIEALEEVGGRASKDEPSVGEGAIAAAGA